VAPGTSRASLETVRLELARILGRSAFPAQPGQLVRLLRRKNAPDALVEALERLPRTARYTSVQELARELTRSGRPAARQDAGERP
jgi:hypothetical protein